jgi:hypothetical protein
MKFYFTKKQSSSNWAFSNLKICRGGKGGENGGKRGRGGKREIDR